MRRPRPLRRTAATALALVALGAFVSGCSQDDGGSSAPTTTAPAIDAKAQQKAMDAAERVLSTIRLPGAAGFFAESTKTCPSGQFPHVRRTDASTRPPDEVVEQLTDLLEEQGWTYEHLSDGRETYVKEPYQVWVEASSSDDGGTSASVEVVTSDLTCP
jgi:hypothetical protein